MQQEFEVLNTLISNKKDHKLISAIDESFFSTKESRLIFKVLKDLYNHKSPISKKTVDAELNKLNPSFTIDVLDVNTSNDLLSDIYLLGIKAARSELQTLSSYINNNLDEDFQNLITEVNQKIKKLSTKLSTSKDNFTVLDDYFERLKNTGNLFSTGFQGLNKCMDGGLYTGRFYCVGARKKSGKSSLLASISYNLNMNNVPHLYITLEMSAEEVELRNFCRHKGLTSTAVRNMDIVEVNKLFKEYKKEVNNSTYYEDVPCASLNFIKATIHSHVIKYGIKGVIVDYIQLISNGNKNNQTEAEKMTEISQTLASIARSEDIFVLSAAQTNQQGNTRGGEGIKLACDQYYELVKDYMYNSAYLMMMESRYTEYMHYGSPDEFALQLIGKGPYYKEINSKVHTYDANDVIESLYAK